MRTCEEVSCEPNSERCCCRFSYVLYSRVQLLHNGVPLRTD